MRLTAYVPNQDRISVEIQQCDFRQLGSRHEEMCEQQVNRRRPAKTGKSAY